MGLYCLETEVRGKGGLRIGLVQEGKEEEDNFGRRHEEEKTASEG